MYGTYCDNPQSDPQFAALDEFQVLPRFGIRLVLPVFRRGHPVSVRNGKNRIHTKTQVPVMRIEQVEQSRYTVQSSATLRSFPKGCGLSMQLERYAAFQVLPILTRLQDGLVSTERLISSVGLLPFGATQVEQA